MAAPLFLVTWLLFDGSWPRAIPLATAGSIVYLALFGSVLGFALYYHVLTQVQATRVALITLVTPVSALALGNLVNGEPLTLEILLGSLLILSGLALFQLGDRWPSARSPSSRSYEGDWLSGRLE